MREQYIGKKVRVKPTDSGKKRLGCNDDTLTGEILSKVDWLVGCPVFVCDKGILGLGYECEIVEVIDGKPQ